MNRYHIQRGNLRTTVTLDSTLSELLSLKIGVNPDQKDAHSAVRQWLQTTSDQAANHDSSDFSQWLKRQAILYISDQQLVNRHQAWQHEIDQVWEAELSQRIAEVDAGEVKLLTKDEVFKAVRKQKCETRGYCAGLS